MFTHLHLHTQYSLLEGAIRIKDLVGALKSKGFESCAITDHGNMFGAVEFYHALKDSDLKPIIGVGASVIEGEFNETTGDSGRNSNSPGQTQFLCQNRLGYYNLGYMVSLSYTEGKVNGVPCINHHLLEKHSEGLIALSGGMNGEINRYFLAGRPEDARRVALWYRDVFAGRYYIELQNTGLPEQLGLNKQLIRIGHELGIPLVATNDCHYLTPEEAEAQYILWLMGLQRRVTDAEVPLQSGNQRYLKSAEEMLSAFAELPLIALENTSIIAEQCELSLENNKIFLPQISTREDETVDSKLRDDAKKGLEKRIAKLFELYEPEVSFEEFRQPYSERLSFELDVIIQMGFPGYFLIVSEFIKWAKDNGISVGPGRGSGAGSLVAYALLITDIDPLHYGLLFERFLNPYRVSLPDFDIDFDVEGREKVIEHVREKYGEKNVCQISTFGSLKAKAVVRGVARVLDFPYSEADKIAKLVPNDLNITLDQALEKEPELAVLASEGSENEQRLIKFSRQLEDLNTHLGTHAAGVIIMNQDIREVMPVCTGKEGTLQSMYPMKYAEDQGAVKFDFLGLQNLSTIDNTLDLISKSRLDSARVDISRIAMDDPLTFDLFCRADTIGVFQLESSGMKRLVSNMQPSAFEDIVAILALYRPGPLGSGMVEDYVQCKHKRKRVVFPHPLMADILKETYGVLVYQEQIIKSVQVLAGFSLGQADLLRRAIGKKTPEILAEQRIQFVEGCLKNTEFVEQCPQESTPEEKANEIFDTINYFSGYGFNKSHSVAYGMISYQTAYLKAHYPVQLMAALFNGSVNNQDNIINYISECKSMGVKVLPPDVNHSAKTFTVAPTEFRITAITLSHFERDFAGGKPLKDSFTENWLEPLRRSLKKLKNRDFKDEDEFLKIIKLNTEGESGHSQAFTLNPGSSFAEWLRREARVEVIRFGLNAVKNVGGKAVDAILKVRSEHGQLTDFMEFMKKVNLNEVNRRMLETLVKCGAFDSLHENRAQLFAALDAAFHLAQEFQRAEEPSQDSFFDLMDEGDAKATETQLEFPEVRNWPKRERLKQEKAALGFYVSGHPLDSYSSEMKLLATTTAKLKEGTHAEKNKVSLIGIVVNNTVRLNQSNEKFAIVTLEDTRGTIEIPVFASVYEKVEELLESDEPLLISGRVKFRDEEVGMFVDNVRRLSEIREAEAKSMVIKIGTEPLKQEAINLLRSTLQKYSGDRPFSFSVQTPEAASVTITPEEQISITSELIEELEELLPFQTLEFSYSSKSKLH
ncbi:MAG TPA: DNA polymerase III subunit alpha [Candidatus Lambdaproteobacteria bacterium]|nr:DNA polymerase III subunit alpha [Candidatus Lambdaproteobacteria bacterium]HIO84234.1 DNA polymerase III subunit alpha [Deltaproteobacteria bacterium]